MREEKSITKFLSKTFAAKILAITLAAALISASLGLIGTPMLQNTAQAAGEPRVSYQQGANSYSQCYDTWIRLANGIRPYDQPLMAVSNYTGDVDYILIRFSGITIPADNSVTSAFLDLYLDSTFGGDQTNTISVHKLTATGLDSQLQYPTGIYKRGSTAWGTVDSPSLTGPVPGVDYEVAPLASQVINTADTIGKHIQIQLPTSLLQSWIDDSNNNIGLLLSIDATASDQGINFASADCTTVSQRPTLSIGYQPTKSGTRTYRSGLNGYTSSKDTYIKYTGGTNNNGINQSLWVESYNGSTCYGFLKFDNINIPKGAVVKSAQLILTNTSNSNQHLSGSSNLVIYKTLVNIGFGAENNSSSKVNGETSWSYLSYNATTPSSSIKWGNNTQNGPKAGVDYDNLTVVGTKNINALNSSYTVDLDKNVINEWLGGTNNGLMLTAQNGTLNFNSNENLTSSTLNPTLIVNWELPTILVPNITSLNVNSGNLTLSLANLQQPSTNYTYQVWSYENYQDGGSYWNLVKEYGKAFDGAGIDSNGNATLTWQLKGNTCDTYKIFIRIKSTAGDITQMTKEFSSKQAGFVKINSLMLDNAVPVLLTYKNINSSLKIDVQAEGSGNLSYLYYIDDQLINTPSASTCTLTLDSSYAVGIHTIKAKVSSDNNTSDEESVNIFLNDPGSAVPEINGFTVPAKLNASNALVPMTFTQNSQNTGTNAYSIQISEPGRRYFDKVSGISSNKNDIVPSYAFNVPGVYEIFGSIKNQNAKSFSDGAIKYITVNNSNGTPSAVLKSSDVTITNGGSTLTDFNSVSVTGTHDLLFTAKYNAQYQYSFWRLDARGYRLVQDWSDDNTLDWSPAQPGNYSISVRVRDKSISQNYPNASYGAAQSFSFNIGGYSNNITSFYINDPAGPLTKRTAVTLSAVATGKTDSGNLLYRFEINDDMMGTYTIQDYSLNNTATWIPRKTGTYKIIVRVRDQASFGYYDSYLTKDVTIN